MVWCSNCTRLQPAQSTRSNLLCCYGCGKVVIQQNGSKRTSSGVEVGQCEQEDTSLKVVQSVKIDVAKLLRLRPIGSKKAKDAMKRKGSDDSESLSDIDDAEVRSYMLKDEEKILKQLMWERMNNGYAEAANKAAAAKALKLKKEKQQRETAESKKGSGTSKATNKRPSSRVNYDALRELLGESEVASDKSKKSRTDSYSDDDSTSNKYESGHNKFSEWGDYDEGDDAKNRNDRYHDYEEEQYYDDGNGCDDFF